MLFKKIKSLILFPVIIAFTITTARAEADKGFIQSHPYLTAIAGFAVVKLAWNAVKSIIAWSNQVEPRAELKGKKLPIIYSHDCNFNLFGIEKVYWFDAKKYQRIHHYLVKYVGIPAQCFYKPMMVELIDLEHKNILKF